MSSRALQHLQDDLSNPSTSGSASCLLTHVLVYLTYVTNQPAGLIIADQFVKGYNKEKAYTNGCADLFEQAGGVLVYNPEIGKMVGEGIALYALFDFEP